MGDKKTLINNNTPRLQPRICFVVFQLVVFLFMMFSTAAHRSGTSELIKLFAYQLFALFLVGYAVVQILNIHVQTLPEIISLSYAMGGIASLISYLIGMLTFGKNANTLMTIIEILLSIWYLYIFKRGKKHLLQQVRIEGFTICILFLVFYYLLATFSVSFANPLPDETGKIAYFVDWPFWVGNNIAFTKGFPNQNFRLVGTPYKYHYFSSILMAQTSLSTCVDVVRISFSYAYIFGGLLLVFSSYFFASRLLKKKLYVVLAMTAILFTDGRFVWLCDHTLVCPFGFDYGYAYGMLALAALIEIVKNERWKDYFIPSVLFLAMTTGCKGPIALVVLGSFGTATLLMLKSQFRRALMGGSVWLISFLTIFFVFLYSPWTVNSSSGLTIVRYNPIAQILFEQLLETKLGAFPFRRVLKVFTGVYYIASSNPLGAVLTVMVIVQLFFNSRKTEPVLPVLLTATLLGMAAMMFTRQEGSSEMYFMMATFPTAALAGFYNIENDMNRNYRHVLVFFSLVLLIYGSSKWYFGGKTGALQSARSGLQTMRDSYSYEKTGKSSHYAGGIYKRLYIDEIDFEAFTWLKDHSGLNEVVATDSFTDFYGHDNSMLAGIFSERYIWNEIKYSGNAEESERRNSIVDMVKSAPEHALEELLAEGVSFLLHSTAVKMDEGFNHLEGIEEVFHNDHYVIYRLLASQQS